MAKVSVRNLSKTFRGEKGKEVSAVHDVSFDIEDREFVVLVGPSGSGKSTTLRMIAGLEEVTAGEIFIGEKKVNQVAPKDRDIAMVFQNFALYPHMTVYENIAFGLQLQKYPKAQIKRRVMDAAAILGIEPLLERKPRTLSGGQCQRVALGRAMVRQPKVFLFDEPLSNLDTKMRVQLRTEITRLHQRLQATMLYVTHDQAEAMTMADRIVVMHKGVVQQNDAPLTVYNQPANLFVAGFLGNPAMNLVAGKLSQKGDVLLFSEKGDGTLQVSFSVTDRAAAKDFAGKEVILGIRPEDVVMQPASSSKKGDASFAAIIDVVEPMGSETNLYLQTGEHTLVCRTQEIFGHEETGQRRKFQIRQAKAHFFDPATTQRIG